ncbi:MAG TPA: hypothetical protein VK168_08865 [Saprospiraceae bacterium]|nr:hypothetical protein [Saprospiraceae bacterium]
MFAQNCFPPQSLSPYAISSQSIVIRWQSDSSSSSWELEIKKDSLLFDGIPDSLGQGDSLRITNLMPETRYFWRIRTVCIPNGAGNWSPVLSFHTPTDCTIPKILPCNSFVAAFNNPAMSLIAPCPNFSTGAELYYQFTPILTGEHRISTYASGPVKLAFKKPNVNCQLDSNWTCLAEPGILINEEFTLGQLTAGQTYMIAVDFSEYQSFPNINIALKVLCPVPCNPPTGLTTSNIAAQTAELNWVAPSGNISWEIEIQPTSANFTGIPNFFSNHDSLIVSGLTAIQSYKWRVRAMCGPFSPSSWSNNINFTTLVDCYEYPILTCDQEVVLTFESGNGQLNNLPTCGSQGVGKEEILQFHATSTTHYLFLPEGLPSYNFYIKNANAGICAVTTGWQCIGSGENAAYFELNNLTPGDDYFILCKKRLSTGLGTLRISFHCEQPCPMPVPTQTFFNATSTQLIARWSGNHGPWLYEIGLLKPDGSEITKTVSFNTAGVNLFNLFAINTSELYGWRIRNACQNGDSSLWTDYSYFSRPICNGAIQLPCFDTLIVSPGSVVPHHYYNVCNGANEVGRQIMLKLSPTANGLASLRIKHTSNLPLQFAVSEKLSAGCTNTIPNWNICGTITGSDTLINLGVLSFGQFQIQLTTADTQGFQVLIESLCYCPETTQGLGLTYNGGKTILVWKEVNDSRLEEIEVVPIDSLFSGTPNYFSDGDSLVIDNLDPAKTYHFRIKNNCGDLQTSQWSQPFPIHKLPGYDEVPYLPCGDTLVVSGGTGIVDFKICGQQTPGKEQFCRIKPEITGIYYLTPVNNATGGLKLSFIDQCSEPFGITTCVPLISGNRYKLGLLYADKTYLLLADKSNAMANSIARYRLSCELENEEPFNLFPGGGMEDNYWLKFGDTCRIFTNHTAYATNDDPNPSIPPGNWHDGAEHSVWFGFIAPPTGTVQITVASDTILPFDPQIAVMRQDSLTPFFVTAEDNTGENPADAILVYSGLTPGNFYLVMVDGAFGTSGRFCISIKDEPDLWSGADTCQQFVQSGAGISSSNYWRNLYASNTDGDPNTTGPLLGAILSENNLGDITVSTEILPEAPVLPNGQKFLPRYFNIETQFSPVSPVKLRLFFTAEDLESFNITPPETFITPDQLGLTHYDGNDEDCDPTNNVISGSLPVANSQTVLVGENGVFYLEAIFNGFSEFGASLPVTIGTKTPVIQPSNLLVHPNPFSDEFTMRFYCPKSDKVNYHIFDLFSNIILEGSISANTGLLTSSINLSGVLPGIYQIVIYQQGVPIGAARVVKM